jgi:hypothetical protein
MIVDQGPYTHGDSVERLFPLKMPFTVRTVLKKFEPLLFLEQHQARERSY